MGPIVYRAETKGKFLPGVVFAKGCEFVLVSLGDGFGVWGRVQGGGGGGRFPVENKGGQAKEPAAYQQVNAQALSKLPFGKLPFSF